MTHAKDNEFRENSISIGKLVIKGFQEKDLTGRAKEVAYSILFALAPLLIFFTALAGWITQTVNSEQQNPAKPVLDWMTDTLPPEAANFLREPVEAALKTSPGFLLSFGALFALWGAQSAMSAVIKGLNVTYGIEKDSRSWIRKTAISIFLTVAMALMLTGAGLMFVLGTDFGQDVADTLGVGEAFATFSVWTRWPVIALVVILAVAIIHKFGPNVDADLKWYLPGAAFTVIAMAIATFGLGLYFSISGGYAEAYGTFGAVLAFLFWLYIMCVLILLGGVINMAVQKEIPAAKKNVDENSTETNGNAEMLASRPA